MINTLNVNPTMEKLLLQAKSVQISESCGRKTVAIRASKKQLWFFAYESMKNTGHKFSTTDGRTHYDYPVGFAVGNWNDGSVHYAKATANRINGPYWVTFTLEFDNHES